MTQDYEPVELTESTPEPKEDGIYLLTITFKSETQTMPLYKDGNEYLGADSTYSWGETVKELSTADEVTIQSLADHDAEVRDKALSLTDDELAIAEGAYESSVMKYESDGLGAMSIAIKAVAEDRRKQ